MPIKLKANNGNIDLQVPIKQTGVGAVDSVNGMTGDVVLEIPSKISQLENDSGFITQHQSLEGLATKSEVKAVEDKIPSLENYALKSQIPTKTSQLSNDSGYFTEHQSLADYALKSEIPTVPTNVSALTNDSGYLTLATLPKYTGGVE